VPIAGRPTVDILDIYLGYPCYPACSAGYGGALMTMIKTPIEIDQEALAVAAEVLGTKTKKDTVNAALREVGQRLVRLRALARLGEMADAGDFDEFLGDKTSFRP
jgi:Arc/MetJ family transcription regulator